MTLKHKSVHRNGSTPKHLSERIHGKDPFLVIEDLAKLGWSGRERALTDVP